MPIGTRLEEALDYLSFHPADSEQRQIAHGAIDFNFKQLVETIWEFLPEGPGKTVAIRAIGSARMECNSAIANGGN